ncbi:Photosystem I assembly protein Ycf4 [Capsicum annuum]|nr:Photosystem I assembly protein Ycf4 [Capsicum annuum]KAF3615173.1 Photosystem I assembly protein Ycf4 [Capsicum annuum]
MSSVAIDINIFTGAWPFFFCGRRFSFVHRQLNTTCTWTERPYEALLFPGIGFGPFLRSLGGRRRRPPSRSSGYDRFDIKEGIVCIFHWGFPGKNRRLFLRFLIKDIQFVRIEVKEGIYARRVLYMDIRGQGSIPLTCTDENLTLREIEQKAAELTYFLRVPIEVF